MFFFLILNNDCRQLKHAGFDVKNDAISNVLFHFLINGIVTYCVLVLSELRTVLTLPLNTASQKGAHPY